MRELKKKFKALISINTPTPVNELENSELQCKKEPTINMGPKDFKVESTVFQYDREWKKNLKKLLNDTL